MLRTVSAFAIMLALCVIGTLAAAPRNWSVDFIDSTGNIDTVTVFGRRICLCVDDRVRPAKIKNSNGGQVRLFSTTNCTGNFASLPAGQSVNAAWVKSISIGEGGIPAYPPAECQNRPI
ncbi:hypothetical protein BG004_004475 [Podila humilis]|nr:hypothetical protein BG004_004475 [Podila humilis]